MDFPAIIVEVPRRSRATAYALRDRDEFRRVYEDAVSRYVDRKNEWLDRPIGGNECAPENDGVWIEAISHDIHTVVVIDSVEDAVARVSMGLLPNHQYALVVGLVYDAAVELWGAEGFHGPHKVVPGVEVCMTPEAARIVYADRGGWIAEETGMTFDQPRWLVGEGVEAIYPDPVERAQHFAAAMTSIAPADED